MIADAASCPPPLARTPVAPPGMRTWTKVPAGKPWAGTNWMVPWPVRCQVPGTSGVIVGIGEPSASGAENCTWIGAAPFTPCWCWPGVVVTTVSGGTDGLALAWPDLAVVWDEVDWPEAEVDFAEAWGSATQAPPASRMTMTPPSTAIRPRN